MPRKTARAKPAVRRRPVKAAKKLADVPIPPGPEKLPIAQLLAPEGSSLALVIERGNAVLRQQAALAYISSRDCPTIRQLNSLPEFAHLTTRTLERWSAEDKWADRRRDFLAQSFVQIQAQLGNDLVQARLRELRSMEKILGALDAAGLKERKDGRVELLLQPRSLEQWARVRLDYAESIDKLRSQLVSCIPPSEAPEPQTPTADEQRPTMLHPNLRMHPTEQEAVAMAMLLMRMRREEVERQMAIDSPSELEEPAKKKRSPMAVLDADEES